MEHWCKGSALERNIKLALNTLVLFPGFFFWNFYFYVKLLGECGIVYILLYKAIIIMSLYLKLFLLIELKGKSSGHYDYKHPFLLIKKKKLFKHQVKTDHKLRFMNPKFSSVAQSCPALCDPMDCSTPGLPVRR